MKRIMIIVVYLAFPAAIALSQQDTGNMTNETNMSNATGIGAGATGNMSGCPGVPAATQNATGANDTSGMGAGTGENATGVNASMNNTSMNNTSGAAYSMGVSRNESQQQQANNTSGMGAGATGENATGMNASMNNTSMNNTSGAAYGMGVSRNESQQQANNTSGLGAGATGENATGMNASVGNATNATGDLGASLGGMMSSYSFEQKDQMVKDVQDQIRSLDRRYDESRRQGNNQTARTIQNDRDQLKRQLSTLKKANQDNWDMVQKDTVDMIQRIDTTG